MYKKRVLNLYDKVRYSKLELLNSNFLSLTGNEHVFIYNSQDILLKRMETIVNAESTSRYYYYSSSGSLKNIVSVYTSIANDYKVILSVFEYSSSQILEKQMVVEEEVLSERESESYKYKDIDILLNNLNQSLISKFIIHNVNSFNEGKVIAPRFISEIDQDDIKCTPGVNITKSSSNDALYKIDDNDNILFINYNSSLLFRNEIGFLIQKENFKTSKLYTLFEESVEQIDYYHKYPPLAQVTCSCN